MLFAVWFAKSKFYSYVNFPATKWRHFDEWRSHTSYLSFNLHRHPMCLKYFTPKCVILTELNLRQKSLNRSNTLCKIHVSPMHPGSVWLHHEINTLPWTFVRNINYFTFNQDNFTPDRKNLHRHHLWRLWQIWGMRRSLVCVQLSCTVWFADLNVLGQFDDGDQKFAAKTAFMQNTDTCTHESIAFHWFAHTCAILIRLRKTTLHTVWCQLEKKFADI